MSAAWTAAGIDEAGDVAGGEGSGAQRGGAGEEAAASLVVLVEDVSGVISEERMMDSRLPEFRRSMWFPSRWLHRIHVMTKRVGSLVKVRHCEGVGWGKLRGKTGGCGWWHTGWGRLGGQ